MDGLDDLELTAEQEAYQTKEMQALMKHEGFTKAVDRTVERIRRQWEAADSLTAREAIWAKLQGFRDLIQELRAFAKL
jgi:hypothetical protein